jgi:hypothetical protein
VAPGHAPRACRGRGYDDNICGHYDIDGYEDGNPNKPYPPTILIKHHTWFLHEADLFICCDHILYGVHQSHFDQSLLFREIVLYGRTNEIGVNPYHPIVKASAKTLSSYFVVFAYIAYNLAQS